MNPFRPMAETAALVAVCLAATLMDKAGRIAVTHCIGIAAVMRLYAELLAELTKTDIKKVIKDMLKTACSGYDPENSSRKIKLDENCFRDYIAAIAEDDAIPIRALSDTDHQRT